MADETISPDPIELATELTIAWLGNPNTRASSEEVPVFLNRMHEAVLALGQAPAASAAEEAPAEFTPATTARRSLASKDHIISLIDGKPYKTLRRHLSTHGLTPEQYRERYKLKADYPMVAPTYSEARRAMAKTIGLGQKGRAARGSTAAKAATPKPPSPKAATPKAPARRGRKPKAAPAPE